MGVTKTDLYDTSQLELAEIAKVLGHPARIAILQHLLEVKTCICGDIVEKIGLSQPTISQHLKEMKQIGLIKGTVEGTSVCYCIDQNKYNQISKLFSNLFGKDISQQIECC